MKERSILFNAAMVRAILQGTKTQTRRVLRLPHDMNFTGKLLTDLGYIASKDWIWAGFGRSEDPLYFKCPQGRLGDILWVRETWHAGSCSDKLKPAQIYPNFYTVVNGGLWYPADEKKPSHPVTSMGKCRPSIHMPRWASRINLEITNIRVEKLQAINNADARQEGPPYACPHRHGTEGLETEMMPGEIWRDPYADRHNTGYNDCWVCAFRYLWGSICGPLSWNENPYVWVIEFKRI